MFPLSCAHVCTHTGHKTSAHNKTWSAQKFSLKSVFAQCTYFLYGVLNIDEWSVLVKCCAKEIFCMQTLEN